MLASRFVREFSTRLGRRVNQIDARALDRLTTLEEAGRSHILRALEKVGGVLAGPRGAAGILGVNRSTLWSRMRMLGITNGGE